MILIIDTANVPNSVCVATKKNLHKISWKYVIGKNQRILIKINKLLINNKLKLSDISAIAVNRGPGSYTGLRVGVSVANCLAWTRRIPVYGFKSGQNLSKIIANFVNKKNKKSFNLIHPIYTN